LIPTKSFTGPESLPGIDFSDHLNYWRFGFSAVMITILHFTAIRIIIKLQIEWKRLIWKG
jgi:hypothetical protein